VDLFVAKCISFMRLGGNATVEDSQEDGSGESSTRQRRATTTYDIEDDDDDMESGDPMAWDVLGQKAAFLCNRRPALPSFLLGPLAVEKKFRNTQRTGRSQRKDPVNVITRPEEVQQEDIIAIQNSSVTKMCNGIKARLQEVLENGEAGVEADADESMDQETARAVFKRHNLAMNFEVSLFDFAINPQSFGQTVENLFYISFLVRDGHVRLSLDEQGLPTIRTEEPKAAASKHERGAARHQAIFSLDYGTYHKLIQACSIKESLILHRTEDSQQPVAGRAWYG